MLPNYDHQPDNQEKLSEESILLNTESLARHFKPVIPDVTKLIKFEVSDRYNTFKNRKGDKKNPIEPTGDEDGMVPISPDQNPWDLIVPGMYLGVIPKSQTIPDIARLAAQNDKPLHIYSVTDEFELAIGTNVQPKEYQKNGVRHSQIPMTDFGGGGISKESILAAVYDMRRTLSAGGCIYIHCKAGRARSAMIVATYLAIYPPEHSSVIQYDLKSAVEYLQRMRTQVDLHSEIVKEDEWDNLHTKEISGIGKLQKASEAIAYHQELIAKQSKLAVELQEELQANLANLPEGEKPDLTLHSNLTFGIFHNIPLFAFNKDSKEKSDKDNGNTPLSTSEFKNHLIQLTSFKQLKILAAHAKGKRAAYTLELCQQILNAKDDSWFENRHTDRDNPICKLFNNSKTSGEYSELINGFVKDIESYQLHHNQDTDSFKNNTNVKQLSNYVSNLNRISLTAKLKERSLETTWDDVCNKLKIFEMEPNEKNKDSIDSALDDLQYKLLNRIKSSTKKGKLPKNFNFDLDTINRLKCEIHVCHQEALQKIREKETDRPSFSFTSASSSLYFQTPVTPRQPKITEEKKPQPK